VADGKLHCRGLRHVVNVQAISQLIYGLDDRVGRSKGKLGSTWLGSELPFAVRLHATPPASAKHAQDYRGVEQPARRIQHADDPQELARDARVIFGGRLQAAQVSIEGPEPRRPGPGDLGQREVRACRQLVDHWGPRGDELGKNARKQLVENLPAPREQGMRMPALGHASPAQVTSVAGEDIPFDHGDLPVCVGQHPCSKQSAHAGAEHDGMVTDCASLTSRPPIAVGAQPRGSYSVRTDGQDGLLSPWPRRSAVS
jgi:hypothetical protein